MVRILIKTLVCASAVWGLGLVNPIAASATVITDRATFETSFSTPGMTLATDDFEDNPVYTFDATSAGLTRKGINYVGTQEDYSADPQWHAALFVYPYETYITPSGSGGFAPFSLEGTKNLFGGRSSVDINLPTGIVAIGFDLGFDKNDPPLPQDANLGRSYDVPLAADETTMRVNFFDAGNVLVDSIELKLGASSQFVGYQGSAIARVELDSLLPEKNPDFIKDHVNGHGYWAYTLVDDVSFNVAAVPEPASLAILSLGAIGFAFTARQRRPAGYLCFGEWSANSDRRRSYGDPRRHGQLHVIPHSRPADRAQPGHQRQ
jgi:hypothetical protein